MREARENFDVIVVGAGAAGLSAALDLSPLHTALLMDGTLDGPCSSRWSQGGFAAAVSPDDSPRDHARDTIRVADGLADTAVAFRLTQDALGAVAVLEKAGVVFEKDKNGQYRLNREAGHGKHRILHAKAGDGFGKEMMRALGLAVRACPSVTIFENTPVFELLQDRQGRVCGVAATDAQGRLHIIRARAVILATGGIGALYAQTTNPLGNTGKGLALAARAGAVLSDLEFMQFHPTALDIGLDPAPLATEALRGAGAYLVNGKGERFVDELAPRDVVARANFAQRLKGLKTFLDCRHFIREEDFPNLFEKCRMSGIDPLRDLIPVMPASHYHMGGIATDLKGRSSIMGLWACGEVAATGLHGANRLASNSLMEAVVMGRRASEDIKAAMDELNPGTALPPRAGASGQAAPETLRLIRQSMSEHVGVLREEKGLTKAVALFAGLEAAPQREVQDMALVARLVASMALSRQESRGGHCRVDYPQARETLRKRRFVTMDQIASPIRIGKVFA